jgi:hypothetical protein
VFGKSNWWGTSYGKCGHMVGGQSWRTKMYLHGKQGLKKEQLWKLGCCRLVGWEVVLEQISYCSQTLVGCTNAREYDSATTNTILYLTHTG